MSECSEDMCLVKDGSNVYLGEDGAKELDTICDHVHLSHKNEWTQDCFLSPKGARPCKSHVTLIQEMVSEVSHFLLTVSDTTNLISSLANDSLDTWSQISNFRNKTDLPAA